MAYAKKLTEGWRLTDGILPECLLAQPCDVLTALREAGHVPDYSQGLNAMACEWISARRWKYSLTFDLPEEDDERFLLELNRVCGRGEALLNGETVGEFENGAVRLDLTGFLKPEGNVLELWFQAPASAYMRPDQAEPLPRIGLCAPAVLRAVNFVTVEEISLSSGMEGEDGTLCVKTRLTAHTAGRYAFRYILSLDGELAGMFEFYERLPAARRLVRHDLKVVLPALLDVKRLDETVYDVKVSIERAGVACDVRHMETAFRRREGEVIRRAAVSAWPPPADLIDRLIGLGADGIVLSGAPENGFEKNDFLAGLTVVLDNGIIEAQGMVRAGKLEKLAAGETAWPPENSALWRLRGGGEVKDAALFADADTYARLLRYSQAIRVAREARLARRMERGAAAQIDEPFPFLASNALIEWDGKERPALRSLRHAWKAEHCFVEAAGIQRPGSELDIPIFGLAEKRPGEILTVSARLLTMNGEELASCSYPVIGGKNRPAGQLTARLPEQSCVLIARCELFDERGKLLDRTDQPLCVARGEEEAADLLTGSWNELLVREGECLVNCGKTVVLSADRCLMPGEETENTETEWLNAAEA